MGTGTEQPRTRPAWAPVCQTGSTWSSLIYVSETEPTVPRHYPRCWRSRHTAAAAMQSGKHLNIFVMKRVQRCPSSRWGRDGSAFHLELAQSVCGRVCVHFRHNRAHDKIAYEKKQMSAATLLGGPISTWYIKPVTDYFCISQQFCLQFELIYEPINIVLTVYLLLFCAATWTVFK